MKVRSCLEPSVIIYWIKTKYEIVREIMLRANEYKRKRTPELCLGLIVHRKIVYYFVL